MLRTIWLKTIRDSWWTALGWGIGLGLLLYVAVAVYVDQYPTVAARRKVLGDIGPLLNSFRFLIGDPVDISTPGGFLTFRFLGFIPLVLGIWAILATTSTRAEEQRGIGDLLLTTPHPRSSVLAQQWLGFSLALLGTTLLIWLVGSLGWLATGEPLDAAAMLLTSLNIGFQVWLWSSLGLLVAQFFTSRGAAAGVTIGLLVYTFFLNNIAGMLDWLAPFAAISPFHYYAINKPLAPGFPLDPLAFATAPVLALICFALAMFFVNRRDVAAAYPLFGQHHRRVSHTPLNWHQPLLGNLFLRNLRELRWPTIWWALGISFYVVLVVATSGQAIDMIRSLAKEGSSFISQLLSANFTAQNYIAATLGLLLPIAASAFAITQVASWTADEESGLEEMVLTTPHQRWGVLLSRFAAVTVAVTVLLVMVGLTIVVSTSLSGVDYDGGKMWGALLQLVPLTLLVVALGFAIAAWLKQPGPAVGVVSLYIILAFVLELLGQFLKLPSAISALSIFHEYGTPVITGLDLAATSSLALGALALLGVAIVGFQRRDVVKG